MRMLLVSLALLSTVALAESRRAASAKPAVKASAPTPGIAVPAPTPAPPPPPRTGVTGGSMPKPVADPQLGDARFYKYKLVTGIGLHLLTKSAAVVGGQLGFAVEEGLPLYVGPDLSFSLFSNGNVILAMASAWYEVRIFGSPRLSAGAGLALGPAFISGIPGMAGTAFAIFLDTFLAQDVDDLATVRAQFRPGILGGQFAFMMNLNVVFRFL